MSPNNTSLCASIIEDHPIQFYYVAIVAPDILSSIVNLVVTYIFYRSVEIQHPQFSVIFQSQCFVNFVNLISNSLHFFHKLIPCFTSVYVLVNFNALQFHFLSWFCVSILRLYIVCTQDISDFVKVRRVCLAFVWICFGLMKVINNVIYQFLPQIPIAFVFHGITILPAVLCIFVYVALKFKLNQQNSLQISQHQRSLEENPPQDELEEEFEQVRTFTYSEKYTILREFFWLDRHDID